MHLRQLVHVLLQISLCKFVIGDAISVSNITVDGNVTAPIFTRWPEPPFSIPLGNDPARRGFASWTRIGARASLESFEAWQRLVTAILSLPPRYRFPQLLATIENEDYGKLQPAFCDVTITRGFRVTRASLLRQLITTVDTQIRIHGLNEMQVEIERNEVAEGFLQLTLADTEYAPREKPIFLYAETGDSRIVMVEINSFTRTTQTETLSAVLQHTLSILQGRTGGHLFQRLPVDLGGWHFEMDRSGARAPNFDNKIATRVVSNLIAFEKHFKSDIGFHVWIKYAREAETTYAGFGSLRPDKQDGNSTDWGSLQSVNGSSNSTSPLPGDADVTFS